MVDDGVYVDGLPLIEPLPHLPLPERCSLEIVGVGNVFLVWLRIPQLCILDRLSLSLKNVFLLDESHLLYGNANEFHPMLYVSAGSVNLLDVAVSSPERLPLHVEGKESRLHLSHCAVTKCKRALKVLSGAAATLNRCRFAEFRRFGVFVRDGSSICASDSEFTTKRDVEGLMRVSNRSRAVFRDCRFRGRGRAARTGLSVETGSSAGGHVVT